MPRDHRTQRSALRRSVRRRSVVAADHGSATLELAVVAPALLLVLGLAVYAGRVGIADSALDEAARDAARSASLAPNADSARKAATDAALTTLNSQGLSCSTLTVTLDAAGFAAPFGHPASVTAHVSCVLSLSDLSLPGVPGSKTLTSDMTSPLDQFRPRG